MRTNVQPDINFGAEICRQFKTIYFPKVPWEAKLSNAIAHLFTNLKKAAIQYFPDDSHTDMLRKIAHYTQEDFKELVDICGLKIEQEVLHGTSQGQNRINMV